MLGQRRRKKAHLDPLDPLEVMCAKFEENYEFVSSNPPLPLVWTYTGSTHIWSTNAGTGQIILCPMIIMYIVYVVASVLRVRIKYIKKYIIRRIVPEI